ncbi:MAG: DUF2087 domain-containing protein [Betaproteobacteria bacterium]
MTPESVVRLFAEPARVRAFAAAALGATTQSEVAALSGLTVKEATLALHRLQENEIVIADADGLRVNYEMLRDIARRTAPTTPAPTHGYQDQQAESVVRTFIRDGRLVRLPAQWTRKLIVLHHIALNAFEQGATYDERAVNDILRRWCEGSAIDHVTVRRYLVDLDLMRRDSGTGRYWIPQIDTPWPIAS